MFTYEEFKVASLEQRKHLVSEQAMQETFPEGLATQLQFPFRATKVINRIVMPFISDQIELDNGRPLGSFLSQEQLSEQIRNILEDYRPAALERIARLRPTVAELQKKPKNLYALAGATELAFANKVSRNISTTMGPLWEKIAKISPHVVDPELDFGIKIPGVDIILSNIETKVIEYAQLKTQKNTLTGGQSGRVDAELSLHDNPIFCACFHTTPSWTYNTKRNIPRLVGAEFWSRIGIDYNMVVEKLSELILSLEDGFVDMLGDR